MSDAISPDQLQAKLIQETLSRIAEGLSKYVEEDELPAHLFNPLVYAGRRGAYD